MKITTKDFITIVQDCSLCLDYCGWNFHNVSFMATVDTALSNSRKLTFQIIASSPRTHITQTLPLTFPRHKLLGLFTTNSVILDTCGDAEHYISSILHHHFKDYILALSTLENLNTLLNRKIQCRDQWDFIYLKDFNPTTGQPTYYLQTDIKRLYLLLLEMTPNDRATVEDEAQWNAYLDYVNSAVIAYHKEIAKTTHTNVYPLTENTIVEVLTYTSFLKSPENETIVYNTYEDQLTSYANDKGLDSKLTKLNKKLLSSTSPTT